MLSYCKARDHMKTCNSVGLTVHLAQFMIVVQKNCSHALSQTGPAGSSPWLAAVLSPLPNHLFHFQMEINIFLERQVTVSVSICK